MKKKVTARTQETLDKFKGLPISVSLDNNQAAQGGVEQRQVYSAVGQVLTMKDNFAPGRAFSNQKG